MAANNLEQRVAALEAEIGKLREMVKPNEDVPWWRKIARTFAGDPAYLEAMALGRKYRDSTRPKPTRRRKKSKNGRA